MQYAVLSDSHDHFYNLDQAVKMIKERGIATCFHLGDFCAPPFIRAMVNHAEINWICVWGNVDADKARVLLEHRDTPNLDFAEYNFREYETDSGKIFLTHFPLLGQIAAKSGLYRAVFYGDNHQKFAKQLDNGTLLANPGELAGFATGQPSFGIWDSDTNDFEIIDLIDFKTTK